MAREAGVKAVVLTHMTGRIDRPAIRERIIREMGAIVGGDIIWGEDLMEMPIGKSGPGRTD